MRLFVERARAVAPSFDPDPEEQAVIAEVVRRLDGLPLAIELAAARLHTLDVAEVAAGLDHRFQLLSSGYRTSSRHGSLSAAVSWSYGLLEDSLQRTFADLSVFAGSFTVVDAAAICGMDAAAMTLALDQLVERSLVMRAPDRRYGLLETLRAFGAEQLAADGRADAGRPSVMLGTTSKWVEAADRRLSDTGHATMAEIDAVLPELRTALGWLLDHDELHLAGRLIAATLRIRLPAPASRRPGVGGAGGGRRPRRPQPAGGGGVGGQRIRGLDGRRRRGGRCTRRPGLARERAGAAATSRRRWVRSAASYELFQGRLDEAARWYRRAGDAAVDDLAQRLMACEHGAARPRLRR